MKSATTIERLADDPDHQRALFGLLEDGHRLQDRLRELGIEPSLARISAALSPLPAAAATARLLAEACALFSRGGLRDILAEEGRRFLQTPLYAVATQMLESDTFAGLILHDDRNFQISVVVLPPMMRQKRKREARAVEGFGVTAQGNDIAMRFLHRGEATLSLWEMDPFGHDEPLGPRVARRLESVTVRAGSDVFLEGGCRGMSIEQCDGPLLTLMASCKLARSPVTAHYAVADGRLVSCSAASVKSSRIQLLVTLLRELGWKDGLEPMLAFTSHPDHFVRWHAMREAIAMDPPSCSARLAELADGDPHPQVRDVARASQRILSELPCPS